MRRTLLFVCLLLCSSVSYASSKSPYALWDEAYSLYRTGSGQSLSAVAESMSASFHMAIGYKIEGIVKFKQKDYPAAVEAFEQALMEDPTMIFVYKYLAISYLKTGDFRQAHARIQKYRTLMPKDAEAAKIESAARKGLGDGFFKKERSKKRRRYETTDAAVTTFADSPVSVSVCVAQGVKRFVLKSTGSFAVYAGGEAKMHGVSGVVYDVIYGHGALAVYAGQKQVASISLPCEIIGARQTLFGLFDLAHGKGDFWSGVVDSFFRGRIRLISESGMLSLVNIIGMEEYLYGVLPAEMYPEWPREALKAQAVIARTLAFKRKGQFKKQGYDFLNSTKTQVYLGVSKEDPRTNAAVDATRGVVMALPEGTLPEMFFSSNSGGYTFDKGFRLQYYRGVRDLKIAPSVVFPLDSREMVGYLSPMFDCYARPDDPTRFSAYRWQRFHTQSEMTTLVNAAGFRCASVFGIDVVKRNISGHAEAVSIDTDRGEYRIEGEAKIRDVLGKLRSSLFFVQKMQEGDDLPDFTIWGGGYGHGIGLCQFGASGMAQANMPWKVILSHYYPELSLKKGY